MFIKLKYLLASEILLGDFSYLTIELTDAHHV